MCVDPVTASIIIGAVTTLSSLVGAKMSSDAQNNAMAQSYNQQARQAERANQAALQQQRELDYRNRVDTLRNAESAADKARLQILENRKAMGAARASAGTSGLMGLPLNMITQNYEALIGGVGTNLQSTYTQLNENLFFNNLDSMMRAQSITNQSVPNQPYMQGFGAAQVGSAVLSGVQAGVGSYQPKQPKAPTSSWPTVDNPSDPFIQDFVGF